MVNITDADRARYRAAVAKTLPDTATITRTNVSVACRVDSTGRTVHLEGIPRFMPLPEWRIILTDATDIIAGDQIGITGKGRFFVVEVDNPKTYSVETVALTVSMAAPITATIDRRGTNLLYTLTLLQLGGHLLNPEMPKWVEENFGESMTQPFSAYAAWPAARTDDLPVQNGDKITRTDTSQTYAVFGVLPHPGLMIQLFLQVKPE